MKRFLLFIISAVFLIILNSAIALASPLWTQQQFRNNINMPNTVESNGRLAAQVGIFYDRYLNGVQTPPYWAGERLREYVLQGLASESFMMNLPFNVAHQEDVFSHLCILVERANYSPRSYFGLYKNLGEYSQVDILLPMLHYCTRDEFIWITIFEILGRANGLGHHKSALLTELILNAPGTITNHENVIAMGLDFMLAGGFAYDSTIDRLLLWEYDSRGEAYLFFENMFNFEATVEESFNQSALGQVITFQQLQTAREVDWQLTLQANNNWVAILGAVNANVDLNAAFVAHVGAAASQAHREVNRLSKIIVNPDTTPEDFHIAATELRWGMGLYESFAVRHGIGRVLAVRDDDLASHSMRLPLENEDSNAR